MSADDMPGPGDNRPPTKPPKRVLTTAQLAAELQIGQRWLEDGVRAGWLPHTRLANKVRFTDEDIALILAMCRHRPEQAELEAAPVDVSVLGATRRSTTRQSRTPKQARAG
jgi:hypothetical protein